MITAWFLNRFSKRGLTDFYLSAWCGHILAILVFLLGVSFFSEYEIYVQYPDRILLVGALGVLIYVSGIIYLQKKILGGVKTFFRRLIEKEKTGLQESQEVFDHISVLPNRWRMVEAMMSALFLILPIAWIQWNGVILLLLVGSWLLDLALQEYIVSQWISAGLVFVRMKTPFRLVNNMDNVHLRWPLGFISLISILMLLCATAVFFAELYAAERSPMNFSTSIATREFFVASYGRALILFLKCTALFSGVGFIVGLLYWSSWRYGLKLVSQRLDLLEKGHFEFQKVQMAPYGPGFWLFTLENAIQKIHDRIAFLQRNGMDMYSTTNLISEISSGQNQSLMRQSTSLTETSTTLDEMLRSAQKIGEHASSVVQLAEDTEQRAAGGLNAMEATARAIRQSEEKNQQNLTQILSLSERVQEIERILNFIHAISDETHLIALNAAIEASSAGEYGERFKVVAHEVRDLSDRVARSVKDIQMMVAAIRQATTTMVASAQDNSNASALSARQAQFTLQSFKEILSRAKASSEAAKQIYISIHQQRMANQQISLSFSDISGDMKLLAESSQRYAQSVDSLKKFSTHMEAVIQYFVKFEEKKEGKKEPA